MVGAVVAWRCGVSARGRRRGPAAPADPVPAVLRDRAVDTWAPAATRWQVVELRARAVAGDRADADKARRELWSLGARSAAHVRAGGDPPPVDLLVAEIAAWNRRCAIHAWRNADPEARRGIVIDPPLDDAAYRGELLRILEGGPDLDGIDYPAGRG